MHKGNPPAIGPSRLYGLIGFPLAHSFSRQYFSEKFEREGLTNCRYETFPIPKIDGLKKILADYPDLRGLNVTIPYKEKVLAFLDEKNEIVKSINACNCIKIENGRLIGYNTDVIGFERSLTTGLQPHHSRALILGTGGSAKAVQYVLEKLGIEYKYVSRKPSFHNFSYEQLSEQLLSRYTLIINTTPLGMYPNTTEAAPIPYDSLTDKHYLYDLVYNPEQTLFLQKGAEKGAVIRNGKDMLLIQAEESWKIWNS